MQTAEDGIRYVRAFDLLDKKSRSEARKVPARFLNDNAQIPVGASGEKRMDCGNQNSAARHCAPVETMEFPDVGKAQYANSSGTLGAQ
jgi:hypothetical protein